MSSLLVYDDLVYISPGRKEKKSFDFIDEIPEGDSIKAVGNGTGVFAVDQDGIPVLSIVTLVTIEDTQLQAIISNVVDGQDYLLTYVIQTEISGEQFEKFLVVRARNRGLYL